MRINSNEHVQYASPTEKVKGERASDTPKFMRQDFGAIIGDSTETITAEPQFTDKLREFRNATNLTQES